MKKLHSDTNGYYTLISMVFYQYIKLSLVSMFCNDHWLDDGMVSMDRSLFYYFATLLATVPFKAKRRQTCYLRSRFMKAVQLLTHCVHFASLAFDDPPS